MTSIRIGNRSEDFRYNVIWRGKAAQIRSTVPLDLYDMIEIDDNSEMPYINAKQPHGRASEAECNEIISNFSKAIEVHRNKPHSVGKEIDEFILAGKDAIESYALMLLEAYVSGAPIIIRFHNDGDGSTGAIALYRAFNSVRGKFFENENANVYWTMNKSIAYSEDSLFVDESIFNSYKSVRKPLILITDFGTTYESESAIKKASKRYSIIWIDHHPIYDGFPYAGFDFYINPWTLGMNSNICAGVITASIAEKFAPELDFTLLKKAALDSDHSKYYVYAENAHALALVLDSLTANDRIGYQEKRITPKYLEATIADPESFAHVLNSASAQIAESLDIGVKNAKRHVTKSGIAAYVLDYKAVADRRFEYIKQGRYTTKLQDKLEETNGFRTITIVYYKNYISVRVNKGISNSINLLGIIAKLKENTAYIQNGGGHSEAASIKVGYDETSSVMHLLLDELIAI